MQRRKFLITFLLILLGTNMSRPWAKENTQHEPKLQWFEEARFGMFVHWGLYSLLGGTYQGRTLPDTTLPNGKSWYAEWIQKRLEIPNDEYQALAKQFNPVNFDADAWIAEAKNAGMKYFVITAKHHDGFALWDSDVSNFDLGATPFKNRDILGELVAACKKYGLRYGFYYSHWQDWEHPQGALPYWEPERKDTDFEKYWMQKCLPQVKELIVRYDPDLLWFDTWDEEAKDLITPKRRDQLIDLVHGLTKKCLINGRIAMHDPGNRIDFLEMMDNTYPNDLQKKPWQTPATTNHTWAYHRKDFNWKSSGQMLRFLVQNAAKGGNYLLNIGPNGSGNMPLPGIRRLREMGAWLLTNGASIYGSLPFTDVPATPAVVYTQKQVGKKKDLYAHILNDLPNQNLIIPLKDQIISCEILDTGEPLQFDMVDEGISIKLPVQAKNDDSIWVLKMQLK
jgi:alpha-L-fucosidase